MLEVVFNDSEKASMRLAKVYNEDSMISGAYSYSGGELSEAELKKMNEGQAIGGSSQDVVNIGFHLDIGDISGEVDGTKRRNLHKVFSSQFPSNNQNVEQFFLNQRQDLETLRSVAKKGGAIRIWRSKAPYSLCGFYYVCYLLRDIDCDISVISLPEFNLDSDNTMIDYVQWDDIESGQLYRYLELEKPVSKLERSVISNKWQALIEEGASLRVEINGQLVSAPDSFYDFIILDNVPKGDFLLRQLIGILIRKYQLGVSDYWYYMRIEKLIEQNELLVVDDKNLTHPYEKELRKND